MMATSSPLSLHLMSLTGTSMRRINCTQKDAGWNDALIGAYTVMHIGMMPLSTARAHTVVCWHEALIDCTHTLG